MAKRSALIRTVGGGEVSVGLTQSDSLRITIYSPMCYTIKTGPIPVVSVGGRYAAPRRNDLGQLK